MTAVQVGRRDIDVGDELRLRVITSGDGPPLVLLHGFTGSAATWDSLRTTLDSRHTVHVLDLPGHGRSSAPVDPARYALERFADDLARVLDTLDIDRTALLGYSMGGRAALRFALEYPARVDALVLESTSPGISDPRERAERLAADMELADAIERDGVASFVKGWERLPLWASQAALPEPVRAALHAQRLANDPGGLARSLRGASVGVDRSVADRLATLTMPTLLVAGVLDAKFVALARTMADRMPSARVEIIEGAGHAVHLERPDAFAAVVAEFLDAPR